MNDRNRTAVFSDPRGTILSRRSLLSASAGLAIALHGVGGDAAHAQGTSTGDDANPVRGGTLTIGVQGDPAALDPHISILDAAVTIFDFVYESLTRLDAGLTPQPAIAESWTVSSDGLVFTFALRPGVTFHNGRVLTSADVQYSLNRVMDPATASPDATHTEGIVAIDAPDEQTVVITLNAPDASFLTRVSRSGLAIVPQEDVEANGDLQQTMVGTGPFVFGDYIPNTSLSFTRNDAYWDAGKPYVDNLEVLIIPVDTSRATALVTGTVDLIQQVPHKDVASIQGNGDLVLAGDQATNLRWIVFNMARAPFDNLALRQAIAQSIDRTPIIDSAVFGYGTPLIGMFPQSFWAGYHGDIPAPNLDAAKAAVAALALPDDFKPKILTFADYQFLAATSTVVQEQLRLIGIESELDPQDNATYLDNLFGGNFDIAVMGASGYTDPNDYLKSILGTGEYTNASRYSNAEFDALLDQGLVEQDQAARAEIYQKAQQIMIDELPILCLYTSNTYEGLSNRVRGFEHSLTGRVPGIRNVWLSE